jgi:hypothetical protein
MESPMHKGYNLNIKMYFNLKAFVYLQNDVFTLYNTMNSITADQNAFFLQNNYSNEKRNPSASSSSVVAAAVVVVAVVVEEFAAVVVAVDDDVLAVAAAVIAYEYAAEI